MLPVWLASVLLLLRGRGEKRVMSDSGGGADALSTKVKRVRGNGG